MILRTLATIGLLALLGLNLALPALPIGRRGSEMKVRRDVETALELGQMLPSFELLDLDGRRVTREDLVGSPLLLVFERSIDWCPFTKMRLLELREAFAGTPDLRLVWVMSDAQINARTRAFVGELGLASDILFLADPKSRLIRKLGLLKKDPEPIETGVPYPTTLLLDPSGRIRFADVRIDYHRWLDPAAIEPDPATLEGNGAAPN